MPSVIIVMKSSFVKPFLFFALTVKDASVLSVVMPLKK